LGAVGFARSTGGEPAATRPQETSLPAWPVTGGAKHHFFGYYDKCPWDRSGRYLLAMQIAFCDRQPQRAEAVTVGMADLKDGNRYVALDETAAWSWQQGCMLQWLGSASEREIIYNVVRDGHYASVIRDVQTGKVRELPLPVYGVSGDGRHAVSLDFDRLHRLRPGYGYAALPERFEDEPAPRAGGIRSMDLRTGENRLIVPIDWAARNRPDARFEGAQHWFNHLQFNPSGTRFTFLHRWTKTPGRNWSTRLYTAAPDGSDVRLLSDSGMVSHFDWRDDHTLLAWTQTKDRGPHFYLIDDRSGEHTVIAGGVLVKDGHCSYSPDRKWILVDTYPDRERKQALMLYRPADGRLVEIGRFYLPPRLTGPFRCDLHPRWNRDGTQLCIDSAHEPTRQVYVIDVKAIVRA